MAGAPDPPPLHVSAPIRKPDPARTDFTVSVPGSDAERALDRFRVDGDHDAFQVLMRPLLRPVRALARRLTGCPSAADDLVQEALIRAYRYLEGFEGTAAGLRAWMFRVVIQLGSETDRWTRRERARGDGAHERIDGIPAVLGDDPVWPSIERELQERLAEAMERLPARQRAAIHLRASEGLDYRGVADAMGCSPGAARMLVHAARGRLFERLEEHLEP